MVIAEGGPQEVFMTNGYGKHSFDRGRGGRGLNKVLASHTTHAGG